MGRLPLTSAAPARLRRGLPRVPRALAGDAQRRRGRHKPKARRPPAFEREEHNSPQNARFRERAFLVGASHARIADNVSDEDRGKLADFRHGGAVTRNGPSHGPRGC